MFRVRKPGEIFLEFRDVGSKAKGAVVQGARNRGIDFLAQGAHLSRKIKIRDRAVVFGHSCHHSEHKPVAYFETTWKATELSPGEYHKPDSEGTSSRGRKPVTLFRQGARGSALFAGHRNRPVL